MRCMLCGAEVPELRLIESIFTDFDPKEVSELVGKETTAETGADTLSVCPGECADTIRKNSDVIIRDEPFKRS